jgi:hypothetical protein
MQQRGDAERDGDGERDGQQQVALIPSQVVME